MNILIIGGGGREHAIAISVARSPHCEKLYITPGNGGTEALGNNIDIDYRNKPLLKRFLLEQDIDMVIVGPEQPLVDGVVDGICQDPELRHIKCVGPKREGAMLEGSKHFAKAFMTRHQIPTAGYRVFSKDDIAQAKEHVDAVDTPIVLKADGLAAGKGVLILEDRQYAKRELEDLMSGRFGDASKTVVIEEFLDGIEFSVFAAIDGENFTILPVAKDYKRIGEGDTGLNTGGMGSISPVPFVTDELMDKVLDRIVRPTMTGLKEECIPYQGFLFFGLIAVEGDPYVIEYNCRLGDPETQSILSRMETDFVELCSAICEGNLPEVCIEISPKYAATVMVTSGGYPQSYQKGYTISIPEKEEAVTYFHSGTKIQDGQIQTSGGRVIAASAMHADIQEAIKLASEAAAKIDFEGAYFRRDIGFDLRT